MFASHVHVKFKAGTWDKVISDTQAMESELRALPGFVRMMVLGIGDDQGTVITVYKSKENWEAAAAKVQELLGRLGPYFAAAPERVGCEVAIDFA